MTELKVEKSNNMLTLEIATKSVEYVVNAPYFFSLTGMTIATAMFVGATLYNGELKQATKGMVTVGSYAGFLFLMFNARVTDTLSTSTTAAGHEHMAYAGIATIIISTLSYIFGILLGVFISQQARKTVREERRKNDRSKA